VALLGCVVDRVFRNLDHQILGADDGLARQAAVTEEFASRRMDQSVRSALAGKTLDEV
jgi:molecular chaperone HscA